ncbi:DNA-binding protein [Pectobacterium brasiliense]|uniref:helix-turn-helix domain-containing transcriptional regulator n=1 Tax=Pectobacterium brasiliense TaxID=180957 RepID=UPI001F0806D9|nr:hypothetical protein [Pectobacterium brasiliense]
MDLGLIRRPSCGIAAFLTALRRVVEARGGVGEIAKKSGLSRQQLYRTLSENGNPTLTTLAEITRAAGVRLIPSPLFPSSKKSQYSTGPKCPR